VEFNVNPFGKVPVCKLKVNGAVPVPELTVNVVVYATPTVPPGIAAELNTGGVATTIGVPPIFTSKLNVMDLELPA
jgi:hypothetical protein